MNEYYRPTFEFAPVPQNGNQYYRPTFDFVTRTTASTLCASTTTAGPQTITSINGYEPIRIEYEPTTVYDEITYADRLNKLLLEWIDKDMGITFPVGVYPPFHAEDAGLVIDAEQLSKDIEKMFEEGFDE